MDFGAFSAVSTCFKFAEFAIAMGEVGSENEVFVRTIQRVRVDLEETERLMRAASIKLMLANVPSQVEYIRVAIFDTKTALNEIGLYVERARSDKDRDGEIGFLHKVRWVLKDHGKLQNRRSELAACQQTLNSALNILHPLELAATLAASTARVVGTNVANTDMPPPVYSPSDENEFISPNQMHKLKSKAATTGAKIMERKADDLSEVESRRHDTSRPPSPTPSLAPSYRTSCSSTNFGPVNPWDDWSRYYADGSGDVTQNIPPPVHRWSTASGMTEVSTKDPSFVAHSPQRGFSETTFKFQGEQSMVDSNFAGRGGISDVEPFPAYGFPHPATINIVPVAEMAAEVPVRKPLPQASTQDLMSWSGGVASATSYNSFVSPNNMYASQNAYGSAGFSASNPSFSNADVAAMFDHSAVPPVPHSNYYPIRPQPLLDARAGTSLFNTGVAPHVSSMTCFTGSRVPSPAPSFVSAVSNATEIPGSDTLMPGFGGSSTTLNRNSQSRRRRAMIEAAIGDGEG